MNAAIAPIVLYDSSFNVRLFVASRSSRRFQYRSQRCVSNDFVSSVLLAVPSAQSRAALPLARAAAFRRLRSPDRAADPADHPSVLRWELSRQKADLLHLLRA